MANAPLLGLLMMAGLGCAGSGPYGRWRAATSQNVVVYTDALLEHEYIQEWLELSHIAYRAFFPEVVVSTVEAVWLKNQPGSGTRLFGLNDDPRAGWTLEALPGGGSGPIGRRGLIVLERAGDTRATRDEGIAKRQMAHLFVMKAAPQAPLWLQVGLTSYLARFRVHHRRGSWIACFGTDLFDEPPEINLVPGARSGHRVTTTLDQLFTTDWYRYDRSLRYWYEYTAYALVHFLIHGGNGWHRTRFPTLLRAIGDGKTGEEALALAYPDLLDHEWEERLTAHVRPALGPARLAATPELIQGTCLPIPAAAHAADRPRRLPARPQDIQAMLEDLQRVEIFRRHATWFPREIVEAEAARRPGRRRRPPAPAPGGEAEPTPEWPVPTITAPR